MQSTNVSNMAYTIYVNSLKIEMQRLKIMNETLSQQNRSIQNELDKRKKFRENMRQKFDSMHKATLHLCKLNTILTWNANDIIDWICQLENGRFIKYKDTLLSNMKQQHFNGVKLSKVTPFDLHRLGVIYVKDQYVLLCYIKQLFQ
eukprot:168202_1